MTDPVEKPAEEVVEKADDAVPDPVKDSVEKPEESASPKPPDNDGDGIPDWGKSLIEKVDQIAETVAAPVTEPESDTNPVKRPWNKRGFFK